MSSGPNAARFETSLKESSGQKFDSTQKGATDAELRCYERQEKRGVFLAFRGSRRKEREGVRPMRPKSAMTSRKVVNTEGNRQRRTDKGGTKDAPPEDDLGADWNGSYEHPIAGTMVGQASSPEEKEILSLCGSSRPWKTDNDSSSGALCL